MAIDHYPRRGTRRPQPLVLDENGDPSAVPPPVSLPGEDEVRARIETVAGRRYGKQRKQLYSDLARLNADTRRWVLLALFREYALQRRAPGGQRKASRRTVCEPRIKAADYAREHKELERLLRQIEDHPLVYHFCRAHMVRYPKEEARCRPHERWTKSCPECHDFEGPRVGRPIDEQRHRLLTTIVPLLKADGHTVEASTGFVAALCRCFGDRVDIDGPTLQRQWFRLAREANEREKALTEAWTTAVQWSHIRAWTPQLDNAACSCHIRVPVT